MEIMFAYYKAFEAPGRNWTDWVIAKWTNGPYSHMEIVIGDYMYSSSPRDGHVRKKPHKFDKNTWDYIKVQVDQRDIDNFHYFFDKVQGRKYDWLGIMGFVLPVHDSEKKFFCSEFCTKAGIVMNVKELFDKNPPRVSPNRHAEIMLRSGYEFA